MDTARKLDGLIEEISGSFGEKMISLRREIHREPELGFDTEKTAGKILAVLEGLPLEIETGVAENGIVATLKGGKDGPTVGLRADMDALPIYEETGLEFASAVDGKMHACGHDAHTAMLVGAAHMLSQRREDLSGTVKFFFQPAEEGGGGGKVMVNEGALNGVDSIFALHLWPGMEFGTSATRPGAVMASADKFEIEVKGTGGHGAMPHLTADPVVVAAHIVTALQTLVSREVDPNEPAVVTVGMIGAGSAFNIIPETAKISGTVRSVSPEVRRFLPKRMEELAQGIAKGMRAEAKLDYTFSYPVTMNDPGSAAFALEVASEVIGSEKVSEADHPSMGGEDFAFMLESVPGAYLWLGVGEVSGLHTPRFDFDERIMPIGAALHTALALKKLGV
ncbi:M20 metallopeptidase family protein [Rubrobacter indicoceani]|uniref:M20 metallopeptidase family protein n=1 Tax=Rubrobacter indicoceani TaxID=2051957 RepID=UPI000E5AFF58|nr:amidohydrolase [Rubrobacter indicoceani]